MTIDLAGTWALQQVATVADVTQPNVATALSAPGIKGYSLRVPWQFCDSATDPNWTVILDAGKAYCNSLGLPLVIRFMAGANTPAWVFSGQTLHAGYYLSAGLKCPTPMMPDGSPNTVFENAYRAETIALAAWCRANGVQQLHMSWWGRLFAQFDNNTAFVQQEPGYTYPRWLAAHQRLVDIAFSVAGDDLVVEFPVDGNAGGFTPQIDLSNYTDQIAFNAGHTNWLFQQTNSLGGSFPSPPHSPHVRHGQQMDQPIDYDWDAIYTSARVNNDLYVEVYAASFVNTLPHNLSLLSNILSFSGSKTWRIGGTWDPSYTGVTVTGGFDEVAFYNYALGEDEILEHYNFAAVDRVVILRKQINKGLQAAVLGLSGFLGHTRNLTSLFLTASLNFTGTTLRKFNAQFFYDLSARISPIGQFAKQLPTIFLTGGLSFSAITNQLTQARGNLQAGLGLIGGFLKTRVKPPQFFAANVQPLSSLTNIHWYTGIFKRTSMGAIRAISRGLKMITKNRDLR